MVLATLDLSSLYTNIPQEEGIDIVCRFYKDHYEQKLPIPTNDLQELMWLILEENSFKFNEKHVLQTHVIAMGTKMAVAFSVIFMADLEKQLLAASPLKPFVWKRFIDDIFSLWNIPMEEVSIFVDFANSFHPMIKLFTCEMSSERPVFLNTEVLGTLSTDDDKPRGRRPEVKFPLTALLRKLDSLSSYSSGCQNVRFAIQSEREYVLIYLRSVSDRKFISNYWNESWLLINFVALYKLDSTAILVLKLLVITLF